MSVMEGKRIYDIKFTARTPQNRQIALIINLEIQNNFNTGNPDTIRGAYKKANFTLFKLRSITDEYGVFLHFGLSQNTISFICFGSISL